MKKVQKFVFTLGKKLKEQRKELHNKYHLAKGDSKEMEFTDKNNNKYKKNSEIGDEENSSESYTEDGNEEHSTSESIQSLIGEQKYRNLNSKKDISKKKKKLSSKRKSNSHSSEELENHNGSDLPKFPKNLVSFSKDHCPVYIIKEHCTCKTKQKPSNSEFHLSQDSFGNLSLGQKLSDFILTKSDLFLSRQEMTKNRCLIEEAELALNGLFKQLKSLWFNVKDTNFPNAPSRMIKTDNNLLELVNFCSFVVQEMGADWETFSQNPMDFEKFKNLEQSNRVLYEQLESSRLVQGCMEDEIKYISKEKVLVNEKLKHLTSQLGRYKSEVDRLSPQRSKLYPWAHQNSMTNIYDKMFEVGTHQKSSLERKTSQSSIVSTGFFLQSNNEDLKRNEGNLIEYSFSSPEITSEIVEEYALDASGQNLNHVADDFDTMIQVRDKGIKIEQLQSKLDQREEEIREMNDVMGQMQGEKGEMNIAYDTLLEEHRAMFKEREHYESVLKMIIEEMKNSENSLFELFQSAITKLNTFTDEHEGESRRVSMLEEALTAAQNKNNEMKEEIGGLKDQIAANETEKVEKLKERLRESQKHIDQLKEELSRKMEEEGSEKKFNTEKIEQLKELHSIILESKTQLEKTLAAKEEELKSKNEELTAQAKYIIKYQKKIQDFQKNNIKLSQDIKEHKEHIEQMSIVIKQLRQNLSESKEQWGDRVRVFSSEASQTKEHCKWLQSQIEHLNDQLAQAHDRLKNHEKDKTCLAQQVLSAEEERKLVDRKLQELKSALQGDSILREALMERNDALQTEINKLRRAKLQCLQESTEHFCPTEIRGVEPTSFNSFQPVYIEDPMKNFLRKHGYLSAYATLNMNKRGTEAPRTTISLHSTSPSSSIE